jgi:hypothetical protein
MKRCLAVLALLAAAPAAAFAAEPVRFGGVEAPPLVYAISSINVPEAGLITSRTLFVLQGGYTVAVFSRRGPLDTFPFQTTVTAGQGDPAAYRELVEAMAAVRVGLQGNCFNLPLDTHISEQELRLSWFGRGRRRNTFLVSSENTAVPLCPFGMDRLVNALDDYAFSLRETESLSAPAIFIPI